MPIPIKKPISPFADLRTLLALLTFFNREPSIDSALFPRKAVNSLSFGLYYMREKRI